MYEDHDKKNSYNIYYERGEDNRENSNNMYFNRRRSEHSTRAQAHFQNRRGAEFRNDRQFNGTQVRRNYERRVSPEWGERKNNYANMLSSPSELYYVNGTLGGEKYYCYSIQGQDLPL